MSRRLISSGSRFEAQASFSRAVVDGDWIFVSGTTGFDYARMAISPDLVEQTRQTFRNIAAALAQAGASLDDVVMVRYYLTDPNHFQLLAPVMTEHFAAVRPAATAVVCNLIDPAMKIEIEVIARKTRRPPARKPARSQVKARVRRPSTPLTPVPVPALGASAPGVPDRA